MGYELKTGQLRFSRVILMSERGQRYRREFFGIMRAPAHLADQVIPILFRHSHVANQHVRCLLHSLGTRQNGERFGRAVCRRRTTAKRLSRIRLQGLLGASQPELALRAEWGGTDGEQEFLRRSPPLESLDAAIQLLLAYHSNDPKLQSMTEWTLETMD